MRLLVITALLLIIASPVFAGNFVHSNNIAVKNKVVVDQKLVEFDSRFFYGVDGYYSTINNIKEERATEDLNSLKAENQTLRAQIELLIKLCNGGAADKPTPQPQPDKPTTPPVTPDEPATPDEPKAGGDGDTGGYDVTDLDEKVYEIFKNRCASCHDEKGTKGVWASGDGVVLFKKLSDTLVLQPLENRALIHEVVRRVGLDDKGLSAMPPGAPLPDGEVEVLYQWMQEEATRLREGS